MIDKKQGVGLILVLLVMVVMVVFVHIVPQRPLPSLSQSDTISESVSRYTKKDTLYQSRGYYSSAHKREQIKIRPHSFNPNTADSLTLLEQGLKPWQVRNVIKYRKSGGRFRKRSDMRRLYTIDDEQYRRIAKYIDLPDTLICHRDTVARDTFVRYVSHKRDTILELNTADTAELQLLKGIGRWTAVQIVRYRDQLGGYYSAEQLREIPHIDMMMLDTVLRRFTVDATLVRRIRVNRCAVSTLSRHPYLRFEQAKAIYEYRRSRVSLAGIDELRSLKQLSDDDLGRLSHYLSFE